jgi:ATP-binding cassette subfamily C protein LapB
MGMMIGERGRGLSGGQRHAVTLARMLLRQPKILFLDEPSGSMDTTTEAALVQQLDQWSQGGRTLIVCTHRGSFINLVDRILVIERGRLVVDGPRDVVLNALKNKSLGAQPGSGGGGMET